MEKRFVALEIGILMLSLLSVSIFVLADSKPKTITGHSFFDVYNQPGEFLFENSCSSQGGICTAKNLFGGYSCGTSRMKSTLYSCPIGQGCCLSKEVESQPENTIPDLEQFETIPEIVNQDRNVTRNITNGSYKGILGEAYAESSPETNVFAGYEVQYDDAGVLIYELTSAKTILAVGVDTIINQTDNTITISTPASADVKKLDCKCKSQAKATCSPTSNGCQVDKMKTGPYYGCSGLCRGEGCQGGCAFYDKSGKEVGDLAHQ